MVCFVLIYLMEILMAGAHYAQNITAENLRQFLAYWPVFSAQSDEVQQEFIETRDKSLNENTVPFAWCYLNVMTELQKLNVASQTASAFAHELNQPLLAISSYCEAALMLLKANNPNLGKVHTAIEGAQAASPSRRAINPRTAGIIGYERISERGV